MTTLLSYGQFCEHMVSDLGIDQEWLEIPFAEMPGFDSLRMFELDLSLEELGAMLPEHEFASLTSLRDAYDAYVACIASSQQHAP